MTAAFVAGLSVGLVLLTAWQLAGGYAVEATATGTLLLGVLTLAAVVTALLPIARDEARHEARTRALRVDLRIRLKRMRTDLSVNAVMPIEIEHTDALASRFAARLELLEFEEQDRIGAVIEKGLARKLMPWSPGCGRGPAPGGADLQRAIDAAVKCLEEHGGLLSEAADTPG